MLVIAQWQVLNFDKFKRIFKYKFEDRRAKSSTILSPNLQNQRVTQRCLTSRENPPIISLLIDLSRNENHYQFIEIWSRKP